MEDLAHLVALKLEKALTVQGSDQYEALSAFLVEAKNTCREKIQEITAPEIRKVIGHLKEGRELNEGEKTLVKLWVVGDALAYVEAENNHPEWVRETHRLKDAIQRMTGQLNSTEAYVALHALLTDLDRTIQDIIAYLQDKERIAMFENATVSIDSEEAKTLVRILERKLNSTDA